MNIARMTDAFSAKATCAQVFTELQFRSPFTGGVFLDAIRTGSSDT